MIKRKVQINNTRPLQHWCFINTIPIVKVQKPSITEYLLLNNTVQCILCCRSILRSFILLTVPLQLSVGLALTHFLLFTPESLNKPMCKQLKQLFQPCWCKQLEEGMQDTTPVGFAVEKCSGFHTVMGLNCFRPWMKTNTALHTRTSTCC